jgi:hypothetical protein
VRDNSSVFIYSLVSLMLSLLIGCQEESAIASNVDTKSPAKVNQAPETTPKPDADSKNVSPRISFEKTVCDLGDIGQGTKNTCEFRFTNTARP